jgi:hypothetical protein
LVEHESKEIAECQLILAFFAIVPTTGADADGSLLPMQVG